MAEAATMPDGQRIEGWLRTLPGWEAVHLDGVEPLTEGYSNVLARLRLTGGPETDAVLRVQPRHGIFEPYDVIREGRVLAALAPTPVPVPRVWGSVADPTQLGTPAILIEWIDAPHLGAGGDDGGLDGLDSFVSTLASIHEVAWQGAGLAFLGVPASPAGAYQHEVELVSQRMARLRDRDQPLLVRARRQLREVAPDDGRLALCHGDANVFNYLVRAGEVVAVVDWEQARIGDPRSDLGQLAALFHLKGVPFGPASDLPLLPAYEAAARVPVGDLGPFRALWLYQLAVIHRLMTEGSPIVPWYSWAAVTELLDRALDELAGSTQ